MKKLIAFFSDGKRHRAEFVHEGEMRAIADINKDVMFFLGERVYPPQQAEHIPVTMAPEVEFDPVHVSKPSVDDVMEKLENDPNILAVFPAIKPYIPALVRCDPELTDKFVDLFAYECDWAQIDRLMWSHMTDDERDQLSENVLFSARRTVDNLHLGEQLLRMIVKKILFKAIAIL